jgi:hypothetical protein
MHQQHRIRQANPPIRWINFVNARWGKIVRREASMFILAVSYTSAGEQSETKSERPPERLHSNTFLELDSGYRD